MRSMAVLALIGTTSFFANAQTHVKVSQFGTLPDGSAVQAYTLTDSKLEVKIITFGAHLASIEAPDRAGTRSNVVLGYDTLEGYLGDTSTYMGSVVGRYGNRIAHGTLPLDGQTYHLTRNDHGNTLHGGTSGFDRKNWKAKQIANGVELTLMSPDGDMGFSGTLTAHVRYTLVGDALHLEYSATTDKATVLNLTNHSYFNLAGSGSILNHTLQLNADGYTPVDAGLIPTGSIDPVAGNPFDFRKATPIGQHLEDRNEQLKLAGGYDHNFVLKSGRDGDPRLAAVLTDPASGRVLTVMTTEPGVQFYSGNFLDGSKHRESGRVYEKYAGLCLETQHYPDSPNHPAFPTTTLEPGQTFRSSTIFQFSVDKGR